MDYSNYAKGDPLFDLLRNHYKSNGLLNSNVWKDICKRDMENQKKIKKRKINDKRNYKI